MKTFRTQNVRLTESLQVVVIVLALGHLILSSSVTLAYSPAPAHSIYLGGAPAPSYDIYCNLEGIEVSTPKGGTTIPLNSCSVHDIASDGSITSYRITGPMSLETLRSKYRICVVEENLSLVTYEIKKQKKGLLGGNRAKIGEPICI